ncbi:MAG: PD-(D/E)XK nuclease family protein [bacterium]|nr:PD-(D/E)XK nuclease family protein [bacterium]
MAELKNSFCWSFSQAKDFAECKRRYYWNRYGFWGGWESTAPVEARTAYRLKQLRNKWSLVGDIVEATIQEQLERQMVGAPVSLAAAMARAQEALRRAWREHVSEQWRNDPKHCTCIRELYYQEIPSEASATREAWADQVRGRVETCLRNFFAHVLPRLKDVRTDEVLPVARPTQGDPEHFHVGQVKVYAIPDYAYRRGGQVHIHDWKTGMRREEHRRQLAIYGLWAQRKHEVKAEEVRLYAEYLESGESECAPYDVTVASATYELIMNSVQEMRQYLVDGDVERNEPLPKEAFAKTEDLSRCRQCNYRELCHRQFTALMSE